MLALRRELNMSKYMWDPVRAHVGFAANMFKKMSMQCTLLCICVYMVSVMHMCAGVTRFGRSTPCPTRIIIFETHLIILTIYFRGVMILWGSRIEIKPGHRVWSMLDWKALGHVNIRPWDLVKKKQSISRPLTCGQSKPQKRPWLPFVEATCKYNQVYTWNGVVGCGGYLTIASWSKVL